jgi:hypothetical protein
MNLGKFIEITDKDGWRKEFPLQKSLVHIGCDVRNDIVLAPSRGGGVALRHLQLVAVQGGDVAYRAVNLGDIDISLGASGEKALAPRSATEIVDGDRMQIGDFALIFHFEGGGARLGTTPRLPSQQSSASIGLGLLLSPTSLDPQRPLDGTITVRNVGNMPGVQFRLELEGLDEDCYEMGSGPILFPNAEKSVALRLYHPRRSEMPAGSHEIRIRATAPDAYPGETAIVSQEIEILPYYSHVLRLLTVD